MAKPYQAALKEAALSKQAVDGVKSLNEAWQLAHGRPQVAHGRVQRRLPDAHGDAVHGLRGAHRRHQADRRDRALARAPAPAQALPRKARPSAEGRTRRRPPPRRSRRPAMDGRDAHDAGGGSAMPERDASATTRRVRRRRRGRRGFRRRTVRSRSALPGYRERPQQLAMAHAVAHAIERRAAWSPRPAPAPARRSLPRARRCCTAAR